MPEIKTFQISGSFVCCSTQDACLVLAGPRCETKEDEKFTLVPETLMKRRELKKEKTKECGFANDWSGRTFSRCSWFEASEQRCIQIWASLRFCFAQEMVHPKGVMELSH